MPPRRGCLQLGHDGSKPTGWARAFPNFLATVLDSKWGGALLGQQLVPGWCPTLTPCVRLLEWGPRRSYSHGAPPARRQGGLAPSPRLQGCLWVRKWTEGRHPNISCSAASALQCLCTCTCRKHSLSQAGTALQYATAWRSALARA